MRLICLKIILFIFPISLNAQNELVNIYTSKTTMYGGTEMSGTTTTFAYVFVAQNNVSLKHILFEKTALELGNGDTLIIHQISHQSNSFNQNQSSSETIPIKKSFVAQLYHGNYTVSLNSIKEFENALTYRIHGKKYVAKKKAEIDFEDTFYAP